MIVLTVPLPGPISVHTAPLTSQAFARFGHVIANPRPDARPSNTTPASIAAGALPNGAVSANQGTAIQYRDIASMRDLYGQAPSGAAASPRMTMFVCGARAEAGPQGASVPVAVLERHPFTTQTFVPLTADASKRYLVIVAPSLAPSAQDAGLPVPHGADLPGRGLPDVRALRAFIATGEQAVTYGAGTWHAPMVALGPRDTTIDFVVVQFANNTAVEDCQEVVFQEAAGGPRITVSFRGQDTKISRL